MYKSCKNWTYSISSLRNDFSLFSEFVPSVQPIFISGESHIICINLHTLKNKYFKVSIAKLKFSKIWIIYHQRVNLIRFYYTHLRQLRCILHHFSIMSNRFSRFRYKFFSVFRKHKRVPFARWVSATNAKMWLDTICQITVLMFKVQGGWG